jgi:hypothetical protein
MAQIPAATSAAVAVLEQLIRNTANSQDQADDLIQLGNLLTGGWEIKGYAFGAPPGHRYVLLTRRG